MEIAITRLPFGSVLNTNSKLYDYVDCFESDFFDPESRIGPQEIARYFFSSTPKWVSFIFNSRNQIVRLFGLKISTKIDIPNDLRFNPGDRIGLFMVFTSNTDELVIGEDDKHLNFRVSLHLLSEPNDSLKKKLTISTVVSYNNVWGRFYFFLVKPIHKFIVPAMLKRIINQIKYKL